MKKLDDLVEQKMKQRDKLLARARTLDLEIQGMLDARRQLEGIGLVKAAAALARRDPAR